MPAAAHQLLTGHPAQPTHSFSLLPLRLTTERSQLHGRPPPSRPNVSPGCDRVPAAGLQGKHGERGRGCGNGRQGLERILRARQTRQTRQTRPALHMAPPTFPPPAQLNRDLAHSPAVPRFPDRCGVTALCVVDPESPANPPTPERRRDELASSLCGTPSLLHGGTAILANAWAMSRFHRHLSSLEPPGVT